MMRDEQGVALIITMIVSTLLAVLGLAIAFSSMTELTMTTDLERKGKARMAAEAAYNITKNGIQFNLLATSTSVPQYINYTEPTPGTDAYTYFSRNPLAPIEAMNVDFDSPPTPIGNRTVNGLLTSASGDTLAGGGRYWAKITDNDDGDSDFTADVDGKVHLRVLGVEKSTPGQISTYGGNLKNSVAIIEATLKQDMTFNTDAPFTVYASGADATFSGNSFDFDAYDHKEWSTSDILANHTHSSGTGSAGIDVVYDNPGGGDATAAKTAVYNSLSTNQKDNIIGPESDYSGSGEPSLRDNTANVRNDPNPDAQNIFDPDYVGNFIKKVSYFADYSYPDNTHLSGSGIELGTETDPKITVAEGDFKLTGNGSGSGVLIVKGQFDLGGGFNYRGLILVVGEGWMETKGSNKGIIGGLIIADLDENDGTYSYDDDPHLKIAGSANFYYSSSDIQLGISLLPLKLISWREISPEIEPPY
ncbi:pilus assembly PilX N-terminal domain-containing protein [Acidobacteria bacterium AH-259-A15]|nr:pilus assembly PilX N-terminal domain-containing protein [Acidobacteria bacterium AH-259-A15]